MKQKLTTIGHRSAFNNEQSPYRIVSYKSPRRDKCKLIQTKNTNGIINVQKINEK